MKSVLCILQLPPPIHGASLVGGIIKESNRINSAFDCDYIRISTIPEESNGGFFRRIKVYMEIFSNIRRKIRMKEFDLAYITPCASGPAFYKDFFICCFVKYYIRNVVYHFHNKGISSNRIVPAFIKSFFFRNVNVILLSSLLYSDIKKYVKNEVVYYCPNGIPQNNSLCNKSHNQQNGKVKILFLSNMILSKGVFDLLDACKILKEREVDFVCRFVGPWYEIKQTAFYSKVIENKLEDHVEYLGPRYGADKYEVLKNSDIFTFPTYYPDECFPLVLLEAMSCKLPIVATNEGAISEIIDNGKQGYIIEKNNPEELSNALMRLVNDKSRRKHFGDAGFTKFNNNYTIQAFESRYIEIINSILYSNRNQKED